MTTLNFDTKLNFMFILRNSTDELLKYASICDNIYKYITKIKTGDMVSIIKEIKLNNMTFVIINFINNNKMTTNELKELCYVFNIDNNVNFVMVNEKINYNKKQNISFNNLKETKVVVRFN